MTIAWYTYALIGAFIWGIHYPLIGKVVTVVSPVTIYALPTLLLLITLPVWYKTLLRDLTHIMASTTEIKVYTIILMFTSILGSIAVYKAVQSSNATMASLIEITYPIFVALFAMIMFHENHVTWPVALGGLLIMSGTGVIIYFHG